MSIELLAPAGSPEALDAAIGEGADAVYLGLKDFNARLRSTNFTYAQFESCLRSLRRMGKKIYVTVNTVFEQREADRMYQLLKYLAGQGPDAIIVQDFGVIAMAKAEFPSLRLHASTQMNIASARGANALSRHGVSRVVLSRELSLEELRSIKAESNLELEVFVHGALCISVSGICLFSSFLGGKSANRGMCTQACRRLYRRLDHEQAYASGGYYFSPNDLQLLERVPDLASAGIKALKIEGRMKSASYVGAVVSAYRLVTDAVLNGDEDEIRHSIEQGQKILRNDFARAKTQYFFNQSSKTIDWLNPEQDGGTGISLGTILKVKGTGDDRCALVTLPHGLSLSLRDSVRIHRSDDSGRISHKLIFIKPEGSGKKAGCWISAPQGQIGDHVYLIQTKEMRKRYAPVITKVQGGRGPGREKAPFPPDLLKSKLPAKQTEFPEGLYVAVSKPEDLYIVQSSRPQRVMLTLSRKNARQLLAGNKADGTQSKPLPFKPSEIILTLDPWFPQSIAGYENEAASDEIKKLAGKGYNQYIINNPGHFSMFKDLENIKLIAGPFLYMFNSWSLSFVASSFSAGKQSLNGFISPLENNRQNLILTTNPEPGRNRTEHKHSASRNMPRPAAISNILHSRFFITVFAWPPLFTVRANLDSILNFKTFADNMNETFKIVTGNEGSVVYPEKYFSIIDKIPFLEKAGFKRFIIDLCGTTLKKSEYKDLMKAACERAALPNSSRFNWKDGFYANERTSQSSDHEVR
ncbi:MAG: U32 family peptidase [Treponema sp.]|nr:U32 family peptidase [Treponema sp.]